MADRTATTGYIARTLEDFERTAREEIKAKIPEADLSEGADYDLLSRIMGADSWQHEQPLIYAAEQIFPATADEPFLVRHGDALKIPWPDVATSSGFAMLLGVLGSTQGAGSVLTTQSGIGYTTTAAATIARGPWSNKAVVFYNPKINNQLVLSNTTGMASGDAFSMNGGVYMVKTILSPTSLLIYGRVLFAPAVGDALSPVAAARVPIVASLPGASGNANFYDFLTVGTPAADIAETAVVMELGGGMDEFSEEQYAILLDEVRAERPAGGNRSQLILWGRGIEAGYDETQGVIVSRIVVEGPERCFFYPLIRGRGTGDLYPQGIARGRHLGTPILEALQDFVAPAMPTPENPGKVAPGADIQIRDHADELTDVEVSVQAGPGYGADWTGFFTIDAGPTVTRIPLTTDPIGRITVGDRVAVHVGTNHDLVVVTADVVDAAGITISPTLPYAPVAGELVYPGSSLVEPIRDAILELFDDLGLGDTNPPTRYPAPTTIWPAALDRALVIRTVRGIQGVNNLLLPTPATDVIPSPTRQVRLNRVIVTHWEP